MLPFPADKTRCFEVFNARAVRPAPGAAGFAIDSPQYTQNAQATLAVSMEFNTRAQQRAAAFKHGFYMGSGLFDLGTIQYSCHAEDAPVVQNILEGMKADGLISAINEIPYKNSRSYLYATAKFTPH